MKSSAETKFNFLRIYGTLCLVIGVMGCIYFIGFLLEQRFDEILPGALALAGIFAMGFVCLSTADNSSRLRRLEAYVRDLEDKRLKDMEKDLPEPDASVENSTYFSEKVSHQIFKGDNQ